MSILFKPPTNEANPLIKQASEKITYTEATALMTRFQAGPFVIQHVENGVAKPVHAFHFDVEDINLLVQNLEPSDQVFIGFGLRLDGSHTLVVGGCRPVYDENQQIAYRNVIYNYDLNPMFDYCDPCPPACPR